MPENEFEQPPQSPEDMLKAELFSLFEEAGIKEHDQQVMITDLIRVKNHSQYESHKDWLKRQLALVQRTPGENLKKRVRKILLKDWGDRLANSF